jgi:hypothetical protein
LYILSSKRNNETTNILHVINNKTIFFLTPGGFEPGPPPHVCTPLLNDDIQYCGGEPMACVPKMANVGQISMAREKIVLGIYKI